MNELELIARLTRALPEREEGLDEEAYWAR